MNSRIFLAAGAVAGAVWTSGCARTVAELTPAPGAMGTTQVPFMAS
jgi:hypothetical protein